MVQRTIIHLRARKAHPVRQTNTFHWTRACHMNRRCFLCANAALLAAATGASAAQAAGPPGAALPAAAPMAELTGRTLTGQPYDLRSDAGKVVLVFFWSTDCPVCRDKMPELRLNFEAWRDKGFQLLAVSVDRSQAELRAYDAILGRTVAPSQRFRGLWRGDAAHRDNFGVITHTPTSFLIDRAGRTVKVFRGRIEPALWDDIAELVLT